MAARPENVGILAMEFYVPKRCLPQTALEEQDGCAGKYTSGLGQNSLGFFDDREDVGSILLTALARLLERYGVAAADVGRLEVGTETLVDKSKSVKTALLAQLFGENADVEGVTSTNACYGGTAALFNSVAWVESSAWDGRYAVVVCGDIAVYEAGPARPTGGGGAVAMLIGPDAPLALAGPRMTHAAEVYDFYKPNHSEYATVDGKLSQNAYLTAVDRCWAGLKAKLALGAAGARGGRPDVDAFAHACLHSPYNKLVQKGFARLLLGDFADAPDRPEFAAAEVQAFRGVDVAATLTDRAAESAFRAVADGRFKAMCGPSDTISRAVGNCYTAAVYMNLLSLVANVGAALEGKDVLMFSYGSGAVATAFTIRARAPSGANALHGGEPFTAARIGAVADVAARLAARDTLGVADFNAAMDLRAARYGTAGWTPSGPLDALFPGTYYLAEVDALHRRTYART